MIRSNLKGKVFGKLTVLGLSEISRNGHSRWHVICECGTSKTVLATHLIQGKTISCGCHGRQTGKGNWAGGKLVSGHYYSHVKSGAAGTRGRKPLEFSVTLEYIDTLLVLQDGKCALSNLPINCYDGTASLDRIDSSIGYIEGNLQWLHKDINMMKRHYSTEYFKYLCEKVIIK